MGRHFLSYFQCFIASKRMRFTNSIFKDKNMHRNNSYTSFLSRFNVLKGLSHDILLSFFDLIGKI
jgi:hypothetical protein